MLKFCVSKAFFLFLFPIYFMGNLKGPAKIKAQCQVPKCRVLKRIKILQRIVQQTSNTMTQSEFLSLGSAGPIIDQTEKNIVLLTEAVCQYNTTLRMYGRTYAAQGTRIKHAPRFRDNLLQNMNKVNKILGQMETTVTPLAVPQDISSKGLQKQNQTWKTEISLFLDQQTEKLTQASKPFILTTPETSASTTVYDRTANNQPCNTPSSSGGYSPETTTPPKASAYMPNTPPSSKVSRKLNFEPKKNLATEIQKKHKAARKIRHMFRKPIKEKHNRRSPEEAAKKQSEEQDKQTQKSSEEAEKKQPEERRNVIHYLLATIIVIAGFQWMTNFIPRGLGYLRGKLYKKSGQQITSTPVAKLIPATQISIKQPTLEPKPGKNAASSHIKPKGLISPRNGIVINNK